MPSRKARLPCQEAFLETELSMTTFETRPQYSPNEPGGEAFHLNSIASEAISQEFLHAGFWWLLTCRKKTAILRLSERKPFITTQELLKPYLQCYSTAMSYKYPSMYYVRSDVRVCITTACTGLAGGQAYEDPYLGTRPLAGGPGKTD